MADNIPFTRFSSELLKLGGSQTKTKTINGAQTNTFAQRRGGEISAPPASASAGNSGVKGSVHGDTFSAMQGFFESRGASKSNAQTMALLTIDAAKQLGVHPIQLVENQFSNDTTFRPATYSSINSLRTASDQQNLVNDVNNSKSLKARQIIA